MKKILSVWSLTVNNDLLALKFNFIKQEGFEEMPVKGYDSYSCQDSHLSKGRRTFAVIKMKC